MDILLHHHQEREAHTAQLAQEALQQQNEIDIEEEEVNPSLVSWVNLCDNDKRCNTFCGFTADEFLTLYQLVSDSIEENTGRGMKSKITKQDKLLMVLCYLKHYETLDKMKETFSISDSYLHHILQTTIDAITPILYDCYVNNLNDRIGKENEDENEKFSEAKFVMDITFQPIWKPTGTYNEVKQYFSGKHKACGLKSQCIHDRKGRVVHCISGVRGSVHDLTICRNNLEEVKRVIKKPAIDDEIEDERDLYWSVLVDAGYRGLQKSLNAIMPYKKKPNKRFTNRQKKFNKKLASQRVICERFYGRLKGKFRITSSKYRNSRDEYSKHFRLCVALTNYHIILHPL